MTQTLISPLRISSIDVLRALTMVLMIFVNDLWSLQNIPLWLGHVAASDDGMGLADVVFPAFLFIVGMSLPFAVSSRAKKGESDDKIIMHIVVRAFSLIVMGLFLVNGEYINENATGIHRLVWNVLCCTAFILLFNSYSEKINKKFVAALKAIGVIILLILAFRYKAGDGNEIHGFSTYWWGILGLIGWAYFICGISYVLSGKKLSFAVVLWIVFNLICISAHAHWLPDNKILQMIISPFGDGAMPAFVMGGAVISLIYLHFRNDAEFSKMLIIYAIIAAVLLLLGFYTRPFWGISKIRTTPSWVWVCSAITILTFIVIFWIADLRKKAQWFEFIKPAGTNTLLCYLIPYFAYAIVVATGIHYPDIMLTGIAGLIKSLAFALLVVWIAGWLGKRGLQLKL
jgi:heparan-alpha-glucosaminide N-acetyltransferase